MAQYNGVVWQSVRNYLLGLVAELAGRACSDTCSVTGALYDSAHWIVSGSPAKGTWWRDGWSSDKCRAIDNCDFYNTVDPNVRKVLERERNPSVAEATERSKQLEQAEAYIDEYNSKSESCSTRFQAYSQRLVPGASDNSAGSKYWGTAKTALADCTVSSIQYGCVETVSVNSTQFVEHVWYASKKPNNGRTTLSCTKLTYSGLSSAVKIVEAEVRRMYVRRATCVLETQSGWDPCLVDEMLLLLLTLLLTTERTPTDRAVCSLLTWLRHKQAPFVHLRLVGGNRLLWEGWMPESAPVPSLLYLLLLPV